MADEKKKIGFAGWPGKEALDAWGEAELIDLDNRYDGVENAGLDIVPQNICAIVKRIVSNALALDIDAAVIDVGPGKCDMARMAARIIEDRCGIPVIRTWNESTAESGTPICDSTLPPRKKAGMILDGLTMPIDTTDLVPEPDPPAALWGVPAADLSLYDLFPDGTRLLGWFRCLENRTPALEELELEVPSGVPTVFFAQTFCHKNILARHLANKHHGLYVDFDGVVTSSVRAKIEAFLKFSAR